jgi:hypothetical protein
LCISVQKYLISNGAESTFNLGPDRLGDGTTWAEKTNNHLSPSLTKHKKKTMTYDAGRALKYGGVKPVYGIT